MSNADDKIVAAGEVEAAAGAASTDAVVTDLVTTDIVANDVATNDAAENEPAVNDDAVTDATVAEVVATPAVATGVVAHEVERAVAVPEVKSFPNGLALAYERMIGRFEKARQASDEIAAFYQGNFEALANSRRIFAMGVLSVSEQIAAYAKDSAEKSKSLGRALMEVKSVPEAIKIQGDHAQASIGKMIAAWRMVTGETFKLSEQAIAPLVTRMKLAKEKFGKAR